MSQQANSHEDTNHLKHALGCQSDQKRHLQWETEKSQGRHASYSRNTRVPSIVLAEPCPATSWCFINEQTLEYMPLGGKAFHSIYGTKGRSLCELWKYRDKNQDSPSKSVINTVPGKGWLKPNHSLSTPRSQREDALFFHCTLDQVMTKNRNIHDFLDKIMTTVRMAIETFKYLCRQIDRWIDSQMDRW